MQVGSLFCGAGGLDLGFIQAGHTVVWAFDNDKDSIATYRANIGEHAEVADVKDLDFRNLSEVDIIIGGFPCQGFSMANKFRSGEDSRNQLYRQFVRAVTELHPKYFLAENVRGILSLEQGTAIKQIVKDFDKAGYDVEYQLFNAADFGVPQNRYRVFIWGISKEYWHMRQWPTPTTPNQTSIGRALEGIPEPDAPHSLANHIGSQYKITNRNYIGCRRTDPAKPSPTIIARGNGKGGVNVIQHPGNHRRMTVRETAIIQSFPLNFEFKGSMSSAYRQIGNAVPVKLAEAFGRVFED